jgi:arabinofuranosyltransferase
VGAHTQLEANVTTDLAGAAPDLDGSRHQSVANLGHTPGDPKRVWSWLVLAVPLVIVLVGAWQYRWVQEDAFINFRVIDNLLAGHGPVFNIGERVEVYSDPLWVFSVAGFHDLLPFVSLEWLSVLLGLGGTAAGVVYGGRAIQRFGSSRGSGFVVPLGLLVFSVVAGVWEFATSGLEMGMVFGWIGLSFWLLVRTEGRRTSSVLCAFVVGLGTLIRPELMVMSVVLLVALAFVIAAPGWQGSLSLRRRWGAPILAAGALPLL